jgi:hypothetical protein
MVGRYGVLCDRAGTRRAGLSSRMRRKSSVTPAPIGRTSARQGSIHRRIAEIDCDRIVDDAAHPRRRDLPPVGTTIVVACMRLRRSPKPGGGTATRTRTGNRRSASVIIRRVLTVIAQLIRPAVMPPRSDQPRGQKA